MIQLQDQMKFNNQSTVELSIELNDYKQKSENFEKLNNKRMVKEEEYLKHIDKFEKEHKELKQYCDYLEEHNNKIQQFDEILQANIMANDEREEIRNSGTIGTLLTMQLPVISTNFLSQSGGNIPESDENTSKY